MSNVEEEVIQGMQSKVFNCNYCHRVFTTSQALGGHQNGHRRERELVKRAQRHAQLLANPMHHHSLRLTNSPYIDRRSSFLYGLESASHQLLTLPLPLMNHNPLYYQPYSLPYEYYGERRGEARVSRFNEMRHEPTLNVGRKPSSNSTSVNLELALFKGSDSHGDHIDGKEISATDEEKKSDAVDLTLHL